MAKELAPREHLGPDETLGDFLKRERSLRGVSLREISDTTKISVRVLEALEAEEFDSLPPRAFIVGFLRAYAQCLKIDPQEVLRLYERSVSEPEEVSDEKQPKEDPDDDTTLKRFMLLVVVILFAASLFYVVFLRDWSPKARKTKATTSSSVEVLIGPRVDRPTLAHVGAVSQGMPRGRFVLSFHRLSVARR